MVNTCSVPPRSICHRALWTCFVPQSS